MLLCVDIGNTNITLGLFKGGKLVEHWRLSTEQQRTPDEFALLIEGLLRQAGRAPNGIEGISMASVVPELTGRWKEACRRITGRDSLVVDAGVKTGIRIHYDDPRAVGADRIVDALAAHRLYGGPACIVDFGTATTFDAISASADYLGGAIAPGIGIASQALFQKTARLTHVEIERPPGPIGRNTTHAIQSGLLFGYVGLVEGMTARFRAELGPSMKVIGTGGLVELMAKETKAIEIIAPWLTLEGLRMIYEMNTPEDKRKGRMKA